MKKYFSSKMPRLVAMYLLAVTRDTVDFVHRDRVRDRLQIQRAQMLHAVGEEASCWRTISLDTFRMVRAR